MRRAAIVAVAVVTAWVAVATATSATIATVVVSLAAVVTTTRRVRWRQVERRIVAPTVDTLRRALSTDVTLQMTTSFRQLIPRPAGRLLPLRDMWTAHVVDRLAAIVPGPVRRLRLPRRQPRLTITFNTPYIGQAGREFVNAVIVNKLGVPELVQSWDLRGRTVTATWTPRAQPPARVSGDTVRSAVPPRDSSYFLGVGAGGTPVVVDVDNDSPHILVSGGTGSGKSTLAAVIAVQTLLRGGGVLILDIKTSSHRWARGLPGRILTLTRIEDIHDYLVRLAQFAARRNARVAADPDYQPYRLLVVVEEANSLISRLRSWWETHRKPADPRTSPAVAALAELTHMGRSARVHVLLTGQQVTARAAGGAEARENFGVRLLSRYTANTWRMLAGPGVPMPPRTRHPGRWHLVVDDRVTEVQVPFLTTAEARRILGVTAVTATRTTAVTRDVTCDHGQMSQDQQEETLTLRQAVDLGLVPWSLAATRQRLHRSTNPPRPAGTRGQAHVYRRADLEAWVRQETTRTAQ